MFLLRLRHAWFVEQGADDQAARICVADLRGIGLHPTTGANVVLVAVLPAGHVSRVKLGHQGVGPGADLVGGNGAAFRVNTTHGGDHRGDRR
ncbi:hypothetical protein D3C73_907220 [compost metagenome]